MISYKPIAFSFVALSTVFCGKAYSGIMFEPYYSYRSTKSLDPNRDEGTETETIKNREEKGVRAGLSFFGLLKITASVGESFTQTTSTDKEIVDEYDEIDLQTELNVDPDADTKNLKKKETDTRASLALSFDPSFSIFIARVKAGVTARQRIIKIFENDVQVLHEEPPITYNPTAGIGFGVKFSYNIYAIAEYSFYFYKFPETEPFERALSLNLGFSI
ncbi:MAG: hypothetical protein HRU09_20590 [Oligoflexales bacterium]|nr:hypothetical protein [Oligoflexales bacterium]